MVEQSIVRSADTSTTCPWPVRRAWCNPNIAAARSIDARHDVDEVDAETERFTVVEPAHEEVAGQRQHDQVGRQVVDVRADPAKARDVDEHKTGVGVDQRLQRRERLDPPTRAEIGDEDVSAGEERVDVTHADLTRRAASASSTLARPGPGLHRPLGRVGRESLDLLDPHHVGAQISEVPAGNAG